MRSRTVKLALGVTLATAALAAGLDLTASAQRTGGVFRVIRLASQSSALNFNPLGSSSMFPTSSAFYESLFYVNSLNGKVEPVLGTANRWSADALTLTVTTRTGVNWNDGRPFTARDVAYTFNLIKQHKALDRAGVWSNGLESVNATNDTTVVFTFNQKNTPIFPYIAHQMIVPQHVWSTVTDPVTFTNERPVSTGPFLLDTVTTQAIRVKKNPNYWMRGRPYVDGIVWQMVGGVDAILLTLLRGEGDFSYANIPDVKTTYVDRNPQTNHIFWPTTNSNFLYLNTGKAPFNDVRFRRAVAQAIDFQDVANKAYAGLVKTGSPSGIIPTQRSQWLPESVAAIGLKFNQSAARQLLTQAGYRTNASGALTDRDGRALPTFRILVGAGWVDFIAMAQVIGENLKALGINTVIDQQNWATYSGGLAQGTYDMAISWGWGDGNSPYYLYYRSFAPELSAKLGENAASNFTRYTNPAITRALEQFRETSDAATQRAAVATMARAVMQDVPLITLTDRVNFGTYSTNRFTGFPSEENPYNDASPDDTLGARLMFLNVHLK